MGIQDRDYYRRETSGSLWLTGRAPVTLGIVLANVAVFIAQTVSAFGLPDGGLESVLALIPHKVFSDFQVWRLVTATFCHVGPWHLLWNMVFLWWFGRELEALYGSREFLVFYVLAGILSSLAWALATLAAAPARPAMMLGASGAVMAVTVLYTLYNPRHPIRLYFLFPIEMRWLVLIYLGVDFYGLFGPNYSPVAHVAHLAGAAYAVVYKYTDLRVGRLFARGLLRPRLRVDRPEREPEVVLPGPGSLDKSLEHRMDEVLAKIAREGPQSLTDQERQILDEASRRLRNRRG
jgi:membrane associated rhomboid family serine protease